MIARRRVPGHGLRRRGFTLVELLVALTVGLVVAGAVFEVLFSQWRLLSAHRGRMDARQSLRTAAALLSWEFSATSPAAGDLYSIASDSLTLRALQGTGIVCSHATFGSKQHFGLQQTWGYFDATADDSALVYTVTSGRWDAVAVGKAYNKEQAWSPAPSGGGTPVCFWGDSTTAAPRPEATLQLQGPDPILAGIGVGAPVRVYRRTHYALFQRDGYWWLGRRIGAAADFEIVTGPMLPPDSGGVEFTYYDESGAVTTDPARVARIDIALKARSVGGEGAVQRTGQDSLRTSVFIRG